jgi:D-proline reductase (dithiol) PrdB
MARLDRMPEPMRSHLAKLSCPAFEGRPWVKGPPLALRRVALISTAGLHRRDDRPFEGMSGDYRVIPADMKAGGMR